MITGEDACELARALGFDRAGIAPAEPTEHMPFLHEWLARGHAGEMAWLERDPDRRADPRKVFPGARSVVAVGLVYDPGEPLRGSPVPTGRIARYAGGDDYHELMGDRLDALGAALEARAGRPVAQRAYVDTGPVLERELAARAGLGWIGKNTCLIDPALGSYLFLGVLLTELDLEPGTPELDHCGSCRACLDACPTDAFVSPYVLDASRCISYTTIELRGPIPDALREGQGEWVFGCDVCQEVCPWNQRTRRVIPDDREGLRARLAPRPSWRAPSLSWLLDLDEEAFRASVADTAVRRTKWHGLVRNALVAAGNADDASLVPAVRRHALGDDPVLAEHARWALRQLGAGAAGG